MGADGYSYIASAWRRYCAVAVMAIVLLVNHTDRLVLGILLEPIKAEFNLSDGQLGLLTGPAFALVYAVCVIPIARLAERRSRVGIVLSCLLVWSMATLACGLAGNFVALMAARMLVGASEAGGVAPSMSAVSDIFPAHQRARAMSIFALGASAGVLIAPWAGGFLLAEFGWRPAFVILGLLGLPVAGLLIVFVREPQRGQGDAILAGVVPISFPAALASLCRRRSYVLLVIAYMLVSFAQFAMLSWLPAFFQRSYGIEPASLGAQLGLYQGVPLLVGTIISGIVGDRLVRADERWFVWLPMLAAAVNAPVMAALFTVSNQQVAFLLLSIPSLVGGIATGATYALIQNLAAVHSRATAMAVFAFCVTVVGAGLGPLTLGLLSQSLSAAHGTESLRLAFFVMCPIYLLSALSFWAITFFLRADFEDARRDSQRPHEALG